MSMATKAGLLGRWRIDRKIENRIGPDAAFTGEGVFEPDAEGLIWRESGRLTTGGETLTASRVYLWRFGPRVTVLYEEGAPFHDFDPAEPSARHLCGEDVYEVAYAFTPPDRWRAEWRVTGPAKDYLMISEMTRL
ncbi:MAG: DUF6314 family protein [Pseudomonadota bacterium]